jgi:molybdopterin-containing oxidoreductase family membrane subunit
MSVAEEERLTATLLRPMGRPSALWWIWVIFLAAVVGTGFWAIWMQMERGFGLTGIRWPVYWGFLITDFVFWIGISHAGMLITAILRLVDAGWRRPITRCAELITVFSLMIGALFPIIHLGKPWLFFWLMPYPSDRLIWPNFRSPLVWDFFAISTYFSGSFLFLLLPMIPDFALIRDRSTGLRRKIFGLLAVGWRGTTKQWNRLETGTLVMALSIFPVAISVHTIVSFDFSMAPVPMWQSTIFGPYFVAGAIFSGLGGLIIVMAAMRKFLGLQDYLQPIHFQNLGKLLLLLALLWGYFVFNERIIVWYGNHDAEVNTFMATQKGDYMPFFWFMVFCNWLLPLTLLAIKKFRTITGCVVASFSVCIGMWFERYLIIVPSLSNKFLPYSWGEYAPRPSEILITIATFAAISLLYTLFAKVMPVMCVWEMKAAYHVPPADGHHHHAPAAAGERQLEGSHA